MKPAGLAVRLIAWILDLVFIAVLGVLLGQYEVGLLPNMTSIDTNAGAIGVLLLVFWMTLILYQLVELASGRSPAKWILKLSARRRDGKRLVLGRRFARCVGSVLPFMFIPAMGVFESDLLVWPCLVLSAIFSLGALLALGPAKRTLADLVAGAALFEIEPRNVRPD
jgi:hypothetical protein